MGSHLVFHGAVVSLLSCLSGVFYGRAIVSKKIPSDSERAWRLTHSAGTMGGIALIAVGSAVPILVVNILCLNILYYSAIVMGYVFLSAMTMAAMSGQRGLKAKGSLVNKIIFAQYAIASVATLVFWITLIIMAC